MSLPRASLLALALLSACAAPRLREGRVLTATRPPPPIPAAPDAPAVAVATPAPPRFEAPSTLREEHLAIQAAILAATHAPEPLRGPAVALAELARPHFAREDAIALPPLGLLVPLAEGSDDPALRDVLPLTDALRAELPRLREEHARIAAAAQELEAVAMQEGDVEMQLLARVLQAHARAEEEIFYPAAVLVGEVVRARLGDVGPREPSESGGGPAGE
jgi:hypothetical protein